MTGNDSRPSLWERFVNWETGDESVLDGAQKKMIKASVDL